MYLYFSFSTTKPGCLILKPYRTTLTAVRDISQFMSLWQVLVDEVIWIIICHTILQLDPLEARDMTHNHDLCRHCINHFNLIYKYALLKLDF
jgi:hypothetical protein